MENSKLQTDDLISHGYEVLHTTKAKRENLEWNIGSINASRRLQNIENLYFKSEKETVPLNKHYEMKNTVNRIIADIEKNYDPKSYNPKRIMPPSKPEIIFKEKSPQEKKKVLGTFKKYSKYAEHLLKLCSEPCEKEKTEKTGPELKPFQRLPNSSIPVASSKITRRKVIPPPKSHLIIEKNVPVDEFDDQIVIRHIGRPAPKKEIIEVFQEAEAQYLESPPPVVEIKEKPKKLFADVSTQIFKTSERKDSANGTDLVKTEDKIVSTSPQLTITKNPAVVEIPSMLCDVAVGDDESVQSNDSPGLLAISESLGQIIEDPEDALEKVSCLSSSSETIETVKSKGEFSEGEIYDKKFKNWFFGGNIEDDSLSYEDLSLDTLIFKYDGDSSF